MSSEVRLQPGDRQCQAWRDAARAHVALPGQKTAFFQLLVRELNGCDLGKAYHFHQQQSG